MKQKQKAFTLIELLVVIAIIGILATLAVVALQQARANSRDAKRVADVKQVSTALEMYFNDHQVYPDSLARLEEEGYMQQLPVAPTPADEGCLPEDNEYVYDVDTDGGDYQLSFCTGKKVSDLPAGELLYMTPAGITTNESLLGGDPFEGDSGVFTDTRDGQEYDWVKVGEQTWMAENLKYLPSVNSTSEFGPLASSESPAYSVYGYDGTEVSAAMAEANYETYGVLYNGYAVEQDSVCPEGFHVPSDVEFIELEEFLGMCSGSGDGCSEFGGYRGVNEGSKLAGRADLWIDGALDSNIDFSLSGFDVLPSGSFSNNGSFYDLGLSSYIWTSSVYSSINLWGRKIDSDNSAIYRAPYPKTVGRSVRCLKD